MECACGSQAGEYRNGISKKNNKPWKGWKCAQCGNMQFLRDSGGAPAQAKPSGPTAVEILLRIEKLIVSYLNKKDASKGSVNVHDSELAPDDEITF